MIDMTGANMNPCERVQQWLGDAEGDGDALSRAPQSIAPHLVECDRCADAWGAARLEAERVDRFLSVAIPEWRGSVPRVDLADAVLARLAVPAEDSGVDGFGDNEAGRAAWMADVELSSTRGPAATPVHLGRGWQGAWRSRFALVALSGAAALVAIVSLLPGTAPRAVPVASGTGAAIADSPNTGDSKGGGDVRVAVAAPTVPASSHGGKTEEQPFRLSHVLVDANAAWADLAEETAETVGDVVALSRPAPWGRPAPPAAANGGGVSAEGSTDGGALTVPVDWIPLRKQMDGALEFLRDSLRDDDDNGPRAG